MSILPYPARLKSFRHRLLGSLFPSSCLLCGSDSGNTTICTACHGDLPLLPEQRCPLCADQTTHGERCGACLKDPPHFDRALAAFRYDFPLDRLIHALKYGHQLAITEWCAEQLMPLLAGSHFDRIIPLPLHADRLRERGFNQSGEIAKKLAALFTNPVDLASLCRTRATTPQADLPHKERQRNVRGAFECRSDLSGQHILLIDDVLTTAATANECARVLKLHGAATVTVAVLARALKD